MVTEAVKKIKEEMGKNNNPYVQVIGAFLIQHVEANPGAAEKVLDNGKSIIKSLDEMKKVAAKKAIGGVTVLTDQEGFEVILKYFGIETEPSSVKAIITEKPKPVTVMEKKKSIDFDVNLEDFI